MGGGLVIDARGVLRDVLADFIEAVAAKGRINCEQARLVAEVKCADIGIRSLEAQMRIAEAAMALDKPVIGV